MPSDAKKRREQKKKEQAKARGTVKKNTPKEDEVCKVYYQKNYS